MYSNIFCKMILVDCFLKKLTSSKEVLLRLGTLHAYMDELLG